jgi:hypothetical protein
MSGFDADIDALRNAANAAASLAEQAGDVDLVGCLSGIPTGMPGSGSATAAQSLADVWGERLASWAASVRSHGEKLSNAANGYEASDEAAQAAFGGGFLERILPWP